MGLILAGFGGDAAGVAAILPQPLVAVRVRD
jgi:hypothetical protein